MAWLSSQLPSAGLLVNKELGTQSAWLKVQGPRSEEQEWLRRVVRYFTRRRH